jgi:hypothetical protein
LVPLQPSVYRGTTILPFMGICLQERLYNFPTSSKMVKIISQFHKSFLLHWFHINYFFVSFLQFLNHAIKISTIYIKHNFFFYKILKRYFYLHLHTKDMKNSYDQLLVAFLRANLTDVLRGDSGPITSKANHGSRIHQTKTKGVAHWKKNKFVFRLTSLRPCIVCLGQFVFRVISLRLFTVYWWSVFLPSRPSPLYFQSGASKFALRAVITTMCCMSRQVKLGLYKKIKFMSNNWSGPKQNFYAWKHA